MARTVKDTKLDSREARSKLAKRQEPYWRAIDQGQHLGYYKGARANSWVARYRPDGGTYVKTTLGLADDTQDANGVTVLSFSQAQERAREWFRAKANPDGTHDGAYTVRQAIEEYMAWFRNHRRSAQDFQYRIDAYILPKLGDIEIAKLTVRQIRRWHEELANTPARLRTRKGKKQQYRDQDDSPESLRRRRNSANRVLTILKAACNHAYREGKVASDDAGRRVRPFQKVDTAKIRYLTEAECVRLVNACPSDLRQLVRAALLTGCRYGELAAMQVADFDSDAGTVLVRESKNGKPRHAILTEEGQEFFRQAAAGRDGTARVFLRADGEAWGRSHQHRPQINACKVAKISPAASFHILRHTHASHLALKGVPMAVIAVQLGHSDTRMTEKHYAHLSPSYVADTIRAHLPIFGIVPESNVVSLEPQKC